MNNTSVEEIRAIAASLSDPTLEMRIDAWKRLNEIADEYGYAVRYAERLASAIGNKHYPGVEQWKPLSGDLVGLLTQIDNMTTDLKR